VFKSVRKIRLAEGTLVASKSSGLSSTIKMGWVTRCNIAFVSIAARYLKGHNELDVRRRGSSFGASDSFRHVRAASCCERSQLYRHVILVVGVYGSMAKARPSRSRLLPFPDRAFRAQSQRNCVNAIDSAKKPLRTIDMKFEPCAPISQGAHQCVCPHRLQPAMAGIRVRGCSMSPCRPVAVNLTDRGRLKIP